MLTQVNVTEFRKNKWNLNDLAVSNRLSSTIYDICEIHEIPFNGVTEIQETLWRMYED
jgi:hypothetical protein